MSRRSISLGHALLALIDHRGKTPKKLGGDWSTAGHRVVSALNIKGSRVDDNDHHYVDEDLYAKWMKVPLRAGDVLLTSEAPMGEVAYLAEDVDWCLGQRLFGLRADPTLLLGRYLYYLLAGGPVRNELFARGTGSTVSGIRQAELVKITLNLPSLEEQATVAQTLGLLDDRIDSNRRTRALLRKLGDAKLQGALQASTPSTSRLNDLATSIARGVTPKYAEDERAVQVLNQRCIRDGWVTTHHARLMLSKVVAPEKRVSDGDVLVNSTGVGTLGRVGRWHSGEIYADSHVSIVKPDPERVGPTILGYLLFRSEQAIEGMATGSTGQTELGPSQLGDLVLPVPPRETMADLEDELFDFEQQIDVLSRQDAILSTLRDTLLPELLSGRLCVPDAARSAREAVA